MAGPVLPLLMVSEPGSFAEHTIVHRKPEIIAAIISHNTYEPEIVAGLRALQHEIAGGVVAGLCEQAPDVAFWRRAWQPWSGKAWRQLPWFFAETYFYRRVLEIVRYFQPGPWYHLDPFAAQKREALFQGLGTLATFCATLPQDAPLEAQYTLWLRRSLWGNRADLSNVAVMSKADQVGKEDTARLLIDHTRESWQLFAGGQVLRLDVVADNSGLELLSDLGLIDLLLSRELVKTVHLHLKGQPFFVSDAMVKDFSASLSALCGSQVPDLRALGRRLQAEQGAGSLATHDHPFWTTCLFLCELPEELRTELSQGDLLILKGDVNYRRLIQDRHWPPTTDLAAITEHMPTSFLALRTLKGELIVGLHEGQAERLAGEDPAWLTNGERGLIHLVWRPRAGRG
jgi:uncharacterized protein with ATP-grasp and redox domains